MASVYDEMIAMWERERAVLMQRVAKLDAAIEAAKALSEDGSASAVPYLAPMTGTRRKGRTGPSLRVAVVDVVREYRDGVTPRQIADILISRGDSRIRPSDPDPAKPVRTALRTARTDGEVCKADDGTWHMTNSQIISELQEIEATTREESPIGGLRRLESAPRNFSESEAAPG